ncbi:hypothetical protein LINGRAHAP2_LOCUS4188, partial [Linum grandiflorum]
HFDSPYHYSRSTPIDSQPYLHLSASFSIKLLLRSNCLSDQTLIIGRHSLIYATVASARLSEGCPLSSDSDHHPLDRTRFRVTEAAPRWKSTKDYRVGRTQGLKATEGRQYRQDVEERTSSRTQVPLVMKTRVMTSAIFERTRLCEEWDLEGDVKGDKCGKLSVDGALTTGLRT